MTSADLAAGRRGSVLDRFLRLFSDVRPGESGTALLLALNVFILLTSYYILKTVREPLILDAPHGAEAKSYSAAGQAMLLVVLVPLYGTIARRVPRRRLINVITAFFTCCLVTFFTLYRAGVPIGVPFYIWLGVFNLMIIAQFWSFANDLYTTDEGKRLFPMVAVGASAGGVFGALATGTLLRLLGINVLFLIAAALLVIAGVITNIVDTRERKRTEAVVPDFMGSGQIPAATPQIRASTGEFKVPGEAYITASGTQRALTRGQLERTPAAAAAPITPSWARGAFGLVVTNRYLLLVGLMMLALNFVNSTGEYLLGSLVSRDAAEAVAQGTTTLSKKEYIGDFYSHFFAVVNLVGLALQMFAVSRLIKHFGVRAGLMVLPIIAIAGYASLALVPLLAVARIAKTAENAIDYSLQNTVRNALFLPTTREEKYAAKQAIDGFFVRMGDVAFAVVLFLSTHYIFVLGSRHVGVGLRHLALVNMAVILVWIALAVAIGRRYERLVAATA